ncbi:MAG: hypothetical protein Ct9H300mP28_38130 [Pseudomonadota bacterium]|nr:MAG: hypothetical protein Ct9H300mP28_38130 [Pseudomonadota bacterium]
MPNAISLLLIPFPGNQLMASWCWRKIFYNSNPSLAPDNYSLYDGVVWFNSTDKCFPSYLSALLGVLLIVYSAFNLFGFRFEVKTKNEWWLGPFIGLINGLLTGMTGIFVVPCVFYFQGIGFRKDTLIQSRGVFIHGINPDADCFT